MSKKIHIVSFDVPYPPNYGGVIDVFYKLKALSELGVEITLHAFEYGKGEHVALEKYCKEVFYYKRKVSSRSLISRLPFIVKTRKNTLLESRLKNAGCPVLFEGLHTTHILSKGNLKGVKTLVRAHNIEHSYYAGLAESEQKLWKKSFFRMESLKLKKYELVLEKVDAVLTISPLEQNYFYNTYGEKSIYLPVFTNVTFSPLAPEENFVLWHGDLRVSDNVKSALYAIDVVKNTPYKLVVASTYKDKEVIKAAKGLEHVEYNNLKEPDALDCLLKKAKVNLLFTYQPTGIKLKLLNALVKSRFVIANDLMVDQTGLENICVVANTKKEVRNQLKTLMDLPFNDDDRTQRQQALKSFDSHVNAQKIIDLL